MPTDLGPPHDRVTLSAQERRVIASLEYHLAQEERDAARPGARVRHSVARLGARLLKIAPTLLPLAVVLTLAMLTSSTVAGILGVAVTVGLLVLTLVRLRQDRRRRRAAQEDRRQGRA
jgi:Flp pilus assembly protein TadB